jgi:hypothetical protein
MKFRSFKTAIAVCLASFLVLPMASGAARAASPLVSEAELILKLTRLMETPAAEVVFRTTSEGQTFAQRFYGSTIHNREELAHLARAWVRSRPPRRSLEDLYKSLLDLRDFPMDRLASEELDIFATRELSLAPGREPRFLRFYSIDLETMRGPFALASETFVSQGIRPAELGANRVQDLLARSPFVRNALLKTPEGLRVVGAVLKRSGGRLPAGLSLDDALVQALRQPGMEWSAIDLGDRLHDLVGLQSHIQSPEEIARILALDERYALEMLVFKDLRATLE